MTGHVFNYNFEWDPKKAKINIRKHKVSFENAATVFLDPNALSVFDEEHAAMEERWITMGMDKMGQLIIVCHTFTQINHDTYGIRIFSARKPTKFETLQYKEYIHEKGI